MPPLLSIFQQQQEQQTEHIDRPNRTGQMRRYCNSIVQMRNQATRHGAVMMPIKMMIIRNMNSKDPSVGDEDQKYRFPSKGVKWELVEEEGI